jgi:uncharacterized protein (DUF1330 family)
MPAYMLFIREDPIRDPAAIEDYNRRSPSTLDGHAIKPLAYGGSIETVEGEAPDAVVLVEFPTMEEAKDWYFSPAYQAAREYRLKGADYRVMFLEGFQP